jgi:hypothetical protein
LILEFFPTFQHHGEDAIDVLCHCDSRLHESEIPLPKLSSFPATTRYLNYGMHMGEVLHPNPIWTLEVARSVVPLSPSPKSSYGHALCDGTPSHVSAKSPEKSEALEAMEWIQEVVDGAMLVAKSPSYSLCSILSSQLHVPGNQGIRENLAPPLIYF